MTIKDFTDKGLVRLFAALTVPENLSQQMKNLPRSGIDARFAHEDDYHITLRFIGDMPPDRVDEISQALARVRRPKLNIVVRGLDAFDRAKKNPVMFAKVESARKLTALAAEINVALSPLGFDMPDKEFVPHVTFARLNRRDGAQEYIDRYSGRIAASWEAPEFYLMRSAPPDGSGRRYSVLAKYPLKP